MVRIGKRIELTNEEAERLYRNGKTFIMAYKTVFELMYSQAQKQFYGLEIMKFVEPVTKKGRFVVYNKSQFNEFVEWLGKAC